MPALRLAVTGAGGFVGRRLTALAAARGVDVVGVVRSAAGAERVREAGGRPAEVASGDRDGLARALEGCHAVVHLAQIGAERGADSYEAVNVHGTRRVLEAAHRGRVRRGVLFSGLGTARYGLAARCTNRYFLSKLAAEVEWFGSGLEAVVFRPSYILGPGDAFVSRLLAALAAGEVEVAGEGAYRLQPLDVADAAAAALTAAAGPWSRPTVYDLVGPEPLRYLDFVERLSRAARAAGRGARYRVRTTAVAEAERRAGSGGFQGMGPEELDCLLCDEVSDPSPLVALLQRPLVALDAALSGALPEAG